MKKMILLLALALLLPVVAAAQVDLSGMSYAELVELRDQINLAMWASDEWQEVTVPQGVWVVGEDIPAGHWTIKAAEGAFSYVKYGDKLDESGKDIDYSPAAISEIITSPMASFYNETSDRTEIDVDAQAGYYFVIDSGSVIFTPYSGKPSLGFK